MRSWTRLNVTESTVLAGTRPEALHHRRHRPRSGRGALRVLRGRAGRCLVGGAVVFVAGGILIITAVVGGRGMAVYSVAYV